MDVLPEIDLTKRFPVLAGNQMMSPAKCHSCGSSGEDRRYVDLKIHVRRYGFVYLCSYCMNDVAESIGFVPESEANILMEQATHFRRVFDEVSAELEATRRVLDTICGTINPDKLAGASLRKHIVDLVLGEQGQEPTSDDFIASSEGNVSTRRVERSTSIRRDTSRSTTDGKS